MGIRLKTWLARAPVVLYSFKTGYPCCLKLLISGEDLVKRLLLQCLSFGLLGCLGSGRCADVSRLGQAGAALFKVATVNDAQLQAMSSRMGAQDDLKGGLQRRIVPMPGGLSKLQPA